MSVRKRRRTCTAAVLIAVLGLVAVTPTAARAEDEGLWQRWVGEVTDRDKAEIPFAILFSIPAMIVTTPFWLAEVVFDKLTEDD